jgi:hypothetical protein
MPRPGKRQKIEPTAPAASAWLADPQKAPQQQLTLWQQIKEAAGQWRKELGR